MVIGVASVFFFFKGVSVGHFICKVAKNVSITRLNEFSGACEDIALFIRV